MPRLPFLVVALVLAACNGNDPVADEPSNIVGNVDARTLPSDQSTGGPGGGAANRAQEPMTVTEVPVMPAKLEGRWGMTPADCTSTRGDAKGLLTVSAKELRFYESVGRPTSDVKVLGDTVSGNFNFTGEGQTWTRHEVLRLQQGKLVRTESAPMESYIYARCA